MDNKISIDVFVGAENAFHVTSTIVSGEHDAVLIDAQFTRSDAQGLAEKIKATGKNLTTVYVTHGHPDHYWGSLPYPSSSHEPVLSLHPRLYP